MTSTAIELVAAGFRRAGEELLQTAADLEQLLGNAASTTRPGEGESLDGQAGARAWSWQLVETREGVSYRWPDKPEPETYDAFRVYEGTSAEGTVQLGIGECFHRQGDWRYYIVFIVHPRRVEPVVEFREADDAAPEGPFVAIIRGKGKTGREMFALGDQLPSGYEQLPVELHRRHVAEGYNRAAVVARSDQPEIMLTHALLQARLRYGYQPV